MVCPEEVFLDDAERAEDDWCHGFLHGAMPCVTSFVSHSILKDDPVHPLIIERVRVYRTSDALREQAKYQEHIAVGVYDCFWRVEVKLSFEFAV